MRDFSAAAELERLRQPTAQCKAQVSIARQRATTDAHCYRAQAEHFKALAAGTRLPTVQASRLRIASTYERLAKLAESTIGRRELGGEGRSLTPADDARSAPPATTDGAAAPRGGLEDRLARALVNAEQAQIVRQELQLTNDQRQIASAALVKLSRTLCDITAALSRDTRTKLQRSGTQERSL